MPQLIALYSPAPQSGKSEISKYLCHAYGFKAVKFAAHLKKMTRVLLSGIGIPDLLMERYIEGDLKEGTLPPLCGATPRDIQIAIGMALRDRIHPDIWVTAAAPAIRAHLEMGQDVVIDDMRFPNELRVVVALGGQFWKVSRGTQVHQTESEAQLEGETPDVFFHNEGPLVDLHKRVDSALSELPWAIEQTKPSSGEK